MKDLVMRHEKVAFMQLNNVLDGKFSRIKGLTEFAKSKEIQELTIKYVDEKSERNMTTSMSENIAYNFHYWTENDVQKELISIADDEVIGSGAIRTIVTVDFTQEKEINGYPAIKRDYSIVPDAEGAETDVYSYSGTMKSAGEIVKGYASSEDDFKTITFTENTGEE